MKHLLRSGIFALALTLGCSSSPNSSMIDGDSFQTEGWLDEDTFQVRTLGAPNVGATRYVQRRTQASEAALLSAQKRLIELLVGAEIQGACGSDSGESTGCAIVKEFQGHLKGGVIVKKTFDKDDNCEIVFRTRAKGLRKMAETLASHSDFRE